MPKVKHICINQGRRSNAASNLLFWYFRCALHAISNSWSLIRDPKILRDSARSSDPAFSAIQIGSTDKRLHCRCHHILRYIALPVAELHTAVKPFFGSQNAQIRFREDTLPDLVPGP
jgi:hypothetical protein